MKSKPLIFMLSALAILIILLLLVLNSPFRQSIACTEEARVCPDGSIVARNASLDCEFDACPTDLKRNFCDVESRNADACIEIYQPVCGWSDPEKIRCVTYPCASTYSNSCFACQDQNVKYWTEGECPSPS